MVTVEGDPLLSKDIRFLFQPNFGDPRPEEPEHLTQLETIKSLLQVSPGSLGAVARARRQRPARGVRKMGGEKMVRDMALKSVELTRTGAGNQTLVAGTARRGPGAIETIGAGGTSRSEPTASRTGASRCSGFTVE